MTMRKYFPTREQEQEGIPQHDDGIKDILTYANSKLTDWSRFQASRSGAIQNTQRT